MDVGDYIVVVPHVKQIKLAPTGGSLIMASNCVWDAISSKRNAKCSRGVQPPENVTKCVVKEALRSRGLRDDTTCLVVDIATRGPHSFDSIVKKQTSFMRFLRGKLVKEGHVANDLSIMEELFEENSAALSKRLSPDASMHAGSSLLLCAICHCNLASNTSISVYVGSFFAKVARNSWEGPFLCPKCKMKLEEKLDAKAISKQDRDQDAKQG